MILAPGGEEVWRHKGRDYADRPHEDDLLEQVTAMGLDPTKQEPPEVGPVETGPTAVSIEGLTPYLRGAKFASLAIRSRYRDLGEEFRDDTKRYAQMVDRYLEALTMIEERRA